MKPLSKLLSCLIAVGLFCAPCLGRADMGPIQKLHGGGVALKSPHPSIRLESQEVIIRLARTTYTVEAVFHFFNSDRTTTEWVGFPKTRIYRGDLDWTPDFIRFDLWVDGRKVKVTEEPGLMRQPVRGGHLLQDQRWMVSHVKFPSSAPTIIRASYEAGCNFDKWGGAEVLYTYGTGRYWKGNIGLAAFVIDSSEAGGLERIVRHHRPVPSLRLIAGNLERYEIRDFEPNPDDPLSVRYNPRPWWADSMRQHRIRSRRDD